MKKVFISILIGLGLSLPLAAQDLSVDDIVNRINQAVYYPGQDGRAQVQMVIIDSQNRKLSRSFTILRRDTSTSDELADRAYFGEQKFYLLFNRPADVNNMAFLVHKKVEGDDDRWLYLPALDLVKRIAASDKRTSFVGSDYYYEDVSGRNIDLDNHELLETTDQYYVLKHTPRDPDSVEFSYYLMKVLKDSFIPVETTYYDRQGQEFRVAKALKIEDIEGFPTVIQASMENLETGSRTLMRYAKVDYNIGLPDEVFTERYLRQPPNNYLQ